MSSHSFKILSVCLLLTALLAACGGEEVSFSTANIQQAMLAKDNTGSQTTTVFAPDDTFYAIVNLANAPDDTKVKAVWTAVDVGNAAAPNYLLDEVELTSGDGLLTFDMNNDGAWPAGSYKVDLYLNGELDRTLDFRVQAPLAGEAGSTTTESSGDAAAPVTEPAASGAVATLEDARNAVVQIVAQGSFVDPEVGLQLNAAG
ncbi:MAG: hypothetical protein KDE56_31310, partial [Anaerolineales bacterium]|nr:hypothetical protein [Anaerolineales bacterium]